MIFPEKITNYAMNNYELEEFLIFCILVAGKNANTTAKILDKMLSKLEGNTPFDKFNTVQNLTEFLKINGIGCSSIKSKSIKHLLSANLELKNCSVEDLEGIFGIGAKTARYFILHTRENVKIACLDRHILKHMADLGIKVPKNTPTGRKYKELELKFIDIAEKSGKTIAEYDLTIWNTQREN